MKQLNVEVINRDLLYIIQISEVGSLSKAAQMIGIQQSALSRVIQRVEGALEQPLFFRDVRGVRLTPFGEEFVRIIKSQHAALKDSLSKITNVQDRVEGKLTIGAHLGLALNYIPMFWPSLSAEHPKLSLEVSIGSSLKVCEKVAAGELDFGIVAQPVRLRRLVIKKILTEEVCLYVNEKTKTSESNQIILFNPEMPNVQKCLSRYSNLIGYSLPSYDLIARILQEDNHCHGILPSGVAKRYNKIIPINNALDRWEIALIWREDLPKSMLTQTVMKEMIQKIQQVK